MVPREFLKKDRDQIHLSPLANTIYVSCNEFGEWKKIKTDKLGFNNKTFINSFDILLILQNVFLSSLFKKNYNLKTYNCFWEWSIEQLKQMIIKIFNFKQI